VCLSWRCEYITRNALDEVPRNEVEKPTMYMKFDVGPGGTPVSWWPVIGVVEISCSVGLGYRRLHPLPHQEANRLPHLSYSSTLPVK